MLRPPTFEETPQFKRFPDGTCTWFGAPCRLLDIMGEETSYASVIFMHEEFAKEAANCMEQGGNLASLYQPEIMRGMEEFHSHFLCIGFYREGKLIGFWDLPLNWMEGAKLLSSKDIKSPEFQAFLNAATAYANAHPECDLGHASTQVRVDGIKTPGRTIKQAASDRRKRPKSQ